MWPPAPGEQISKYRLERLIGAGGMGFVYLARDLDLARDVALKFIAEDKAADDAARRRLIREARAAAALDHPNICTIHDVFTDDDGHACIVMQYVEGETLAERLRRGPLEPRTALLMAADVAAALAAAHKRGIIHRDIKPQNIVITPSGRAKLLDFGIARLDDSVVEQDATTESRLTGPGRLPGTPAYMSPEQIQQLPLDGRSDLFSLGAVLYECLTGKLPFDAKNAAELYGQILHVHPPPLSSVRAGLSEREDELCRRLLAKHRDDRFSSADELLGALRLLAPDTTRPSTGTAVASSGRWRAGDIRRRRRAAIGIATIAIAVAVAVWIALRPRPLPPAPPEAQRWYDRGTEALRDGSYHSARLAFDEAIKIAPDFALAYARIAEAHGELDDYGSAQTALLKVDQLVDDRSRLRPDDRLRLEAVRALILRDTTAAVKAYSELTALRPNDARVWLDLGRAHESATQPVQALASYDRAIAIDRDYAAAHMRRATILGQQRSRDASLAAFDEAERLYRAASNVEGETETLLRRGTLLNATGPIPEARAAIERAVLLAGGLRSRSHEIRARLRLASITASQGRFAEAETMAGEAVARATESGLEAVVAEGLTDLGTVLIRTRRNDQADVYLSRAIQLADKRGALRARTRAQVQRAYVLLALNRPQEALTLARAALETMRARHYRQYELSGLAIVARSHEALGQYAEAHGISEELLRSATEAKDDRRAADALESLAGLAAAVGNLPQALKFRERLEELHRRQQDLSALPYDLTNRAELLIALGRQQEAEPLLREVNARAAEGAEAFKRQERRAQLLRGLAALTTGNLGQAATIARDVLKTSGDRPDTTTDHAGALLRLAEARLHRLPAALPAPSGNASKILSRELRYLEALAALARGDSGAALAAVAADLAAPIPSYEFEWRAAAVAAAAASRMKDEGKTLELRTRANAALRRLHEMWKTDAGTYDVRPDLVMLRREAGLLPGP